MDSDSDFQYEEEYIQQFDAWACRVYTTDRKHCMAFMTTPTRGVDETRALASMVLCYSLGDKGAAEQKARWWEFWKMRKDS